MPDSPGQGGTPPEEYRPRPLERLVEGVATQEKIDFAREQRREGSDPEKTLWE